MAGYHFNDIEKKWQKIWAKDQTFKAENTSDKPKYYVLDMFPYPSGAGLHVGHPLGYIASDIVSRYKRHRGFNVLHPMGWDAFGLPAEQYAIQTGQHPAVTTEQNLTRYREQMNTIGFSFDWSREFRTSDPEYYKWTQWIFIQLFQSWYNNTTNKAESIDTLIAEFETNGNTKVNAACEETDPFTATQWKAFDEKQQQTVLLNYRLAFLSEAIVNWCPALGTVLANDEVKDGVSERGGHPVERKLMTQWSLRISAYADRLLQGLNTIDWSDSIKEAQRNWIGKSEGTSLQFAVRNLQNPSFDSAQDDKIIEVFTTRPDTIFGVSFVTLAPEHELVSQITTAQYKDAVETYVTVAKNRSERDRMADVKTISGQFTGAYAEHPFTGAPVPIWIGDYVLAGYGTGAVMAVPAHDTRDFAFAKHFGLPVLEVVSPNTKDKHTPGPSQEGNNTSQASAEMTESYDAKEGTLINSDFLNGLEVKAAIKKAIAVIEEKGIGKGKTNYRLRDAVFGRQRYWGEPIPMYYKDGMPYPVAEKDLPIVLPEIDKFLPTETGEPPLARAKDWTYSPEHTPNPSQEGNKYPLETTTMPGWAGSSWYFLRYMDPHNDNTFAGKEALDYWQNVDLYIGGTEHATGHLLYFRFWTKFLYDLGYIKIDEPAKKLVNQGMILGVSSKIYKLGIGSIGGDRRELENNGLFTMPEVYVSKEIGDEINDNIRNSNYKTLSIISSKLKELSEQNPELVSNRISLTSNNLGYYTNIPINYVANNILDIPALKKNVPQYANAIFISNGDFICNSEVEKMSKSKYNVVNPDDVCQQYGADTLRLYEMFLGPLEDAKPWSTQGIEGVLRFLRKLWRLCHNNPEENFVLSDEAPTKAELKILHKTIKKATEDIDNFSFNTSVSAFMVCVNELQDLKCNKRQILEPVIILLSPYAPHICEELWALCGHNESIEYAAWPAFNAEYLVENDFNYPISFNGKVRFNLNFALDMDIATIEKEVLANEQTQKYLEGKAPKKIIVVKGRIVNVVV